MQWLGDGFRPRLTNILDSQEDEASSRSMIHDDGEPERPSDESCRGRRNDLANIAHKANWTKLPTSWKMGTL